MIAVSRETTVTMTMRQEDFDRLLDALEIARDRIGDPDDAAFDMYRSNTFLELREIIIDAMGEK